MMAAAALLFAACDRPEVKEPVKIRLNKELMSNLHVGETQKLEASVTPYDAQVTLVWASDNEAVAVVDDEGNVTGVAPGTAEVTVTADEAVAKCKVTVLAITPEGISLDVDKLEMNIGEKRQLEATITPKDASADDLAWSSSNESVATVKDGVVTAVSDGQAVITVSCNGGKLTAECEVTVAKQAAEKVYVSSISMVSSLELKVGEAYVLNVTVLPENADDKTVTFSLEGDCITLDETTGAIEAVKEGTAKVTAVANDGSGVKAECEVVVTSHGGDVVEIEGVSIAAAGNAGEVQVNKELQLYAHFVPDGAVPNSVSWTVDNQELATIDQNGVLKGVSAIEGSDGSWSKVVVTVNADGKTSSLSFSVIPRQPDDIEVDLPADGQLRIGESWSFNPRIVPEGLGFSVIVVGADPSGKMLTSDSMTASYAGVYSFTFSISDHADLVNSYKILKNVSVNVIPYWVETVSLPATQEMELGASMNIVPSFTSDVEGVEPTYKDVRWSSSDPSVVSVNETTGELKANAAGSAVITATTCHDWSVPSGTAHKSASCTVTVKSSGSSFNVGDYYYSDGTWSSELQTGKTVVGVIFAKVNAASSDARLAQDYPGCTHGLVLGLAEYADQDFGSVSTYNGHGYYADLGYDANMIVDQDKPNGYSNTLAHKDLNASKSDYCKFFNAAEGVVSVHSAVVAAPASASAWYVPSYKEMSLINENRAVVNEAINAAGGTPVAEPYENEASWDENRSSDWYWTSTIKGVWYERGKSYDHYKHPYDISKGDWTTSQQSSGNFKVRVVLAF